MALRLNKIYMHGKHEIDITSFFISSDWADGIESENSHFVIIT